MMSEEKTIPNEYFIKRLGELCLKSGLPGFPKSDLDQQILLKSAVLTLGRSGSFTESEINEKLDYWVKHISQIKNLDRVTLRRRLVDTGYLSREGNGSSYQVVQPGPRPGLFDEAVDQVDPAEAIRMAREEIERRKREYLERSKVA
jgi:hypothetical protein